MESFLSKVLGTLGTKDAPSKDYWVDDSKCKACYECETPFGLLVRRHHCRICGRIFCANCTSNSVPPLRDSPDQQWQRVCNYCHRIRQRSSSFGRPEPGLGDQRQQGPQQQQQPQAAAGQASVDEATTHSDAPEPGSPQHVAPGRAGASGGSKAGGLAARRQRRTQRRNRAMASLARTSVSDGALTWEVPPALESDFGSPAADGPWGPRCGGGGEPAAAAQGGPAASQGGPGGGFAAALSGDAICLMGSLMGLHPLVVRARAELAVVSRRHLRLLIEQLLRAEGVGAWREWLPLVEKMAVEAAGMVSPTAAAQQRHLDPRFYVKVKRLADTGCPEDSCVVRGVAARKNVAHRRMRSSITDPQILLLAGALEYHRVTNKLSSFDTLLDQEREHLRVAVARLTSVSPDVLLVERSVARAAQEELLSRGISLVQHIKPELLERIARTTGAKVVPSVEELTGDVIGTCRQFRIESLPSTSAPGGGAPPNAGASGPVVAAATGGPAPGGARNTLMVFEGCPRPLGCTVLLRGAPAPELTKVKRVVRFAVLAAYHLVLEGAFLAEELALGWAALAPPGVTLDELSTLFHVSVAASTEGTGVDPPRAAAPSLSPHAVLWGEEGPGHEEGDDAASDGAPPGASDGGPGAAGGGCGAEQFQGQGRHHQLEGRLGAEAAAGAGSGSGAPQLAPPPGTPRIQDEITTAASKAAVEDSEAGEEPPSDGSDFTDPLRRKAPARTVSDAGADSGEGGEGGGGGVARAEGVTGEELGGAAGAGAAAQQGLGQVPASAALTAPGRSPWLAGLQLYDRQRIFLSMSCRNPRKQLLCEPPSTKRIDYYSHSDLSLAGFVVAAAPHAQKKCQAAGCGDGVTAHVRTFLHCDARVTLSIATLPAADALPGVDRGQIWLWVRPRGDGAEEAGRQVRRLPLSPESSCLSFGAFLQACFNSTALEVAGRPLHSGFVRYFGLGRTVVCMHQDHIHPSDVLLPGIPLRYSYNAQLMWLKQEAAELCQEFHEAFDSLEAALQQHPYFIQQAAQQSAKEEARAVAAAAAVASAAAAAAAGASDDSQEGSDGASAALGGGGSGPEADPDTAAAPAAAQAAAAAAEGAAASRPIFLSSAAAMLSALRKDRSSFMDKVTDVVGRAAPGSPAAGGADGSASWDEQLMAGLQELNRLRRSLAITSLTWAATLQEPAMFAQTLQANAVSAAAAPPSAPDGQGGPSAGAGAGGPAPGPAPQQSDSPSSAAAAATGAAAAAAFEPVVSANGGASMFHSTPSAVASKIAVPPPAAAGGGQDARDGSNGAGSVPIMPTHGPISLQAVADLVSADPGGLGGLLEGSHSVLNAVARASDSGNAGAQDAAAPEGQPAPRGAGHRRTASSGAGSGAAAPPPRSPLSSSASPRRGAAVAATSPDSPSRLRSMIRRLAGDAGGAAGSEEEEEAEASHEQFVRWLSGGDSDAPPGEDPESNAECFPEQLWDGEDPRAPAAAPAGLPRGAARSAPVPVPVPLPRRGSSGSLSGAAAAAAVAARLQHRRTTSENVQLAGSAPTAAAQAGGDASSLLLQRIKTGAAASPAAAAPGRWRDGGGAATAGAGAAAAAAAAAQQQQQAPALSYVRVVLPGRALMPSGIADCVIPIFDNEPTSIVAYFLSTRSYQLQLNAAMKAILQQARAAGGGYPQQQQQQHQGPAMAAPADEGIGLGGGGAGASTGAAAGPLSVAAPVAGAAAAGGGGGGAWLQQQQSADQWPLGRDAPQAPARSGSPAPGAPTGAAAAAAAAPSGGDSAPAPAAGAAPAAPVAPPGGERHHHQPDHSWLSLLLSPEPTHVKHVFEDDSPGTPWLRARFQVTAYYAPQFAELRRRCVEGGEAAFIASLCRCRKWASRGGKSNAYFAKTRDDRFIVKSLSKQEKASFLDFAPAYFSYMARSMRAEGRPTCLAQVAGVYSIAVKSTAAAASQSGPGGSSSSPYRDGAIDVLVMENIFYDRQISRIYDLKGSERSRFNADAAANPQDAGEVHLDDNLRRSNLQAPILVDQAQLRSMEVALWRDTAFLAALGVMDYSLLVGVDKERNTLVVAIIDFIRQYTWDKQLETWVKSTGILGGNGKEPTIISPKQYCRRFRAAISSYFTLVPGDADVDPPLDPEAMMAGAGD